MTKDELIDITCKWLDYHNIDNKYITIGYSKTFINGGLQTDLRAFLNKVKDEPDYFTVVDKLKNKNYE